MDRTRLHHVGIVLPNVEQANLLIDLLNLEVDYTGYVAPYDTDVIFTKYHDKGESPLEFIIPKSGVLTRYNNGKGGIHHICFEVEDIEAVRREYEAKGFELLEEKAVPTLSHLVANFLRPRNTAGILVELIQTVGPVIRD